MLEITTVADRLGLSMDQMRRLLRAVEPTLAAFVKRGQNNRILLDQGALAVLDRAASLKKDGLALQDIAQTITSELAGTPNGSAPSAPPSTGNLAQVSCQTCMAHLRTIEHLQGEVTWLRQLLGQDGPKALTDGRRLSRWEHLKAALFGRVTP